MQRKQFLRHVSMLMGAAAASRVLTACGGGGSNATSSQDAATDALAAASRRPTTGALSAQEAAGLKYMREEEKLAHDVYAAMHERWGQQVFGNITSSETRHTTAILSLMTRYGMDDPAAGRAAGEFEDRELQALYHTLISAGSVSRIEGLRAGALIEETDIRDIEVRKAHTDKADILAVYDRLLCGSRNHLRAFNAGLRQYGVTCTPQVITLREWNAIAFSAHETCGR